jgi:predicted Holliday junction resolvase-like endonuclease
MNIKPEIIFLVFVGVIVLIGIIWAIRTEKRLKRFFSGRKGKDLEENILTLEENILKLKSAKENIEKELEEINKKLKKSIRGLETIRYNPFPDQGSNQSFAVSMVNEDGDGVVFSSLYSRERMSIFAKPIKNGKSEYELTAEEKEVLKKSTVK